MFSSRLAGVRLLRAIAFSLLLALLTLSLRHAASATVYYAATDGLASNSGLSWSAPRDLPSALAGSLSGDQVWVKAGTYMGNFTATDGVAVYGGFTGTETSLSQRSVAANPTILDGNNSGTVYTIPSGATGTNTLDGFIVQHGNAAPDGGGLFDNSSDTLGIANCTFSSDSASSGGGVAAYGLSTSISHCTFVDDSTAQHVYGPDDGGGILAGGGSVTITACVFSNDSADSGGGILVGNPLYAVSASISDCSFFGNNSSQSGQSGGGIFAYGGNGGAISITRCIFGDSSAMNINSPQAVYLDATGSAASPTVVNDCLFLGSSTGTNNADGIDISVSANGNGASSIIAVNNTFVHLSGGIWNVVGGGTLSVANNIFADNYGAIYYGGTAVITASHNDFYGNSFDEMGATPSATDLFVNPGFINSATSNDRLALGSLLINAGDDSYVSMGDTDLDGNPRIQGSHVDIGAYEYVAVPPTITSFMPTSGPIGTVVTITGTNLNGVTAVRFHNANATVFSANAVGTQLTVSVPKGAATGTFTVTTPGGSVKTTKNFTVIPAPTVTSFTPTSGPIGTVVTVTGTNLNGVTVVRFHNANAKTFSANAVGTQLTVTVPTGAGTGTFTVTTPGGSIKTTGTFTVTP